MEQIFISHYTRDKGIAHVLAKAISQVTLSQLKVWFSSDSSSSGGFLPGTLWLDEVRNRLRTSRAILVLLTPGSIHRDWLLFEAGFGAANPDCEVIPICVGISNLSDVQLPLSMYQCFQLSDYESIRTLFAKLLYRYNIHFDEELMQPILQKVIADITALSSVLSPPAEVIQKESNVLDIAEDVKAHIDQKLVALFDFAFNKNQSQEVGYDIEVDLSAFFTEPRKQYILISSDTTIQNVLDNIYYMISQHVNAYTYLQEWILRQEESGIRVVVEEITELIPAKSIFQAGTKWKVEKLTKPYSALDSEL